jgi:uncharacterized protein YecE (DUF72 family)
LAVEPGARGPHFLPACEGPRHDVLGVKTKYAIGTSGFQYPEWRGKFYPETLSAPKMLAYYADHFSSTESNYTFRRLPARSTLEKWAADTPDDFCFSLKTPQRITHFARLRNCQDVVAAFWEAATALETKLGAILFQLPPAFPKDVPLLADFLASLPSDLRAAFEFRHDSWFSDDVLETLRSAGVALCQAEDENLATPRVATADFGYLRLRRLDYSARQLSGWADWAREQAWSQAFVYFKHEETAVGPKFAAAMQELLA